MSGALSDLQKKPAPLFFHNKNGFLPRIDIHHSTLGNCCLFPGQQMDSRLMNGQPRKAGVDYGKCQAEFEAQMLLLEKDLKKWLHRTQNENEGRKIPDSLRHSSLVGKFITRVFRYLSLRKTVCRSAPEIKSRTRTYNMMYAPWQFRAVASVADPSCEIREQWASFSPALWASQLTWNDESVGEFPNALLNKSTQQPKSFET
ncbi:uncharacterized protein FOBCDRAFT_321471 [Fusarium oxysporum Fo47]|uniref:uncharacterized protein n=1 Tax=Fusarium oxysporum Fo47 TaxID=660027 RepID=UPI0015990858|nr:uncharacterized protein FOBCDRAFT_321471 [Fusarium oxysporum Fo47]QKD57488.1 hypothetical protein FOBCDRAFT_321471 [Fusarium oxysporum Fo47]